MLPVLIANFAVANDSDPEVIERKWAAIGAPLIAYDSSFGVGLGAYGQIVLADLDGDRPYRASVDAQYYRTTAGFQDHFVGWDLPGAFGTSLRWDFRGRFQSWDRAPYYGVGNHSPREEDVANTWYRWRSLRPFALSHLRIPVHGPTELYVGLLWSWVDVAPFAQSLLSEERPLGIAGGHMTSLTLGLFRDTRSHEVDPTDGTALDLALRTGLPAPLSDYHFAGGHASLRGWLQVSPPVVLAGHALLDGNLGGVPFFDQAYVGGLQRTGIGGRYLLRGLAEERLRGDGLAAAQGEVRFRVGQSTVFKRLDLRWGLATFADTGWVLGGDSSSPGAGEPQLTAGGGARVVLNELLVLRLDVGVGIERYVDPPHRRLQPQIYMLAAQPF